MKTTLLGLVLRVRYGVPLFIGEHLSARRPRARARTADSERGQTTAEYALVLLAAASLALLLVAWAAHSGKIGDLFDAVFDHVISKVA